MDDPRDPGRLHVSRRHGVCHARAGAAYSIDGLLVRLALTLEDQPFPVLALWGMPRDTKAGLALLKRACGRYEKRACRD